MADLVLKNARIVNVFTDEIDTAAVSYTPLLFFGDAADAAFDAVIKDEMVQHDAVEVSTEAVSYTHLSLIYLKISFRRDCIHLQAVIDLIAEVEQKGSHIRIAGNQSISLHAFVGFVICVLVFSDVSGKRREQCRRIALLNKIPEVEMCIRDRS